MAFTPVRKDEKVPAASAAAAVSSSSDKQRVYVDVSEEPPTSPSYNPPNFDSDCPLLKWVDTLRVEGGGLGSKSNICEILIGGISDPYITAARQAAERVGEVTGYTCTRGAAGGAEATLQLHFRHTIDARLAMIILKGRRISAASLPLLDGFERRNELVLSNHVMYDLRVAARDEIRSLCPVDMAAVQFTEAGGTCFAQCPDPMVAQALYIFMRLYHSGIRPNFLEKHQSFVFDWRYVYHIQQPSDGGGGGDDVSDVKSVSSRIRRVNSVDSISKAVTSSASVCDRCGYPYEGARCTVCRPFSASAAASAAAATAPAAAAASVPSTEAFIASIETEAVMWSAVNAKAKQAADDARSKLPPGSAEGDKAALAAAVRIQNQARQSLMVPVAAPPVVPAAASASAAAAAPPSVKPHWRKRKADDNNNQAVLKKFGYDSARDILKKSVRVDTSTADVIKSLKEQLEFERRGLRMANESADHQQCVYQSLEADYFSALKAQTDTKKQLETKTREYEELSLRYSELEKNSNPIEMCVSCESKPVDMTALPCGHHFHSDCHERFLSFQRENVPASSASASAAEKLKRTLGTCLTCTKPITGLEDYTKRLKRG